jgi:hypothetical protein
VIPTGMNPEEHIIWEKSRYYGAMCHEHLSEEITHLICGGTAVTDKVKQALKGFPNVSIVQLSWIDDCITQVRSELI